MRSRSKHIFGGAIIRMVLHNTGQGRARDTQMASTRNTSCTGKSLDEEDYQDGCVCIRDDDV